MLLPAILFLQGQGEQGVHLHGHRQGFGRQLGGSGGTVRHFHFVHPGQEHRLGCHYGTGGNAGLPEHAETSAPGIGHSLGGIPGVFHGLAQQLPFDQVLMLEAEPDSVQPVGTFQSLVDQGPQLVQVLFLHFPGSVHLVAGQFLAAVFRIFIPGRHIVADGGNIVPGHPLGQHAVEEFPAGFCPCLPDFFQGGALFFKGEVHRGHVRIHGFAGGAGDLDGVQRLVRKGRCCMEAESQDSCCQECSDFFHRITS